ncbi:hypothetical protein MMC32_005428 [Xylographa parallela]|nr:hypothetical protein [Xylographa parallela]
MFTATLAAAFTTNTPNCTAPPDNVTFVFSPPVRGTMEIVWGCFAVLVTCTWSIQHLSVPVPMTPREEKVQTRRKHSLWNDAFVQRVENWSTSPRTLAFLEKARFNATKLQWMALSVLGPEYILSKALNEHLAAHESRKGFDSEEWTTTHGYFANMRGFVLRFEVAAVKMPLEPSKPSERGRKLHKANPDGEPWYIPQDLEEAEKIELEHCRSVCRVPCPNVDHLAVHNGKAIDKNRKPSLGADRQSRVMIIRKNSELSISSNSGAVLSEKPSAQTISNNRELPTPRKVDTTTRSSIHDGEISTCFAAEAISSTPVSPRTASSADHHYPAVKPSISQAQSEQEALLPHVPWRGTWALSAVQLLYAYRTGIISEIPRLSIEELSDRSKGDALIKTFAIVQIAWLVIQIIARACQNLAVTLLEISVLAIAGCAIATYILLWHKPQDVMVPTYIDAADLLTRAQVAELAARAHVSTLMVKEFWLHGVAVRVMADNIFPTTHGLPVRLAPLSATTLHLNPVIVGFGLGGLLFGAIHLIAWDFHFPTAAERLLWRIAGLFLIAGPLLAPAGYYVTESLAAQSRTADLLANQVLRPAFRVLVPLYLLARLFLLVEVGRSLAYAPASTWAQVAWPVMIPHTN